MRSLVDHHALSRKTIALVGQLTTVDNPETEIVELGWNLDALREHCARIWGQLIDRDPVRDARRRDHAGGVSQPDRDSPVAQPQRQGAPIMQLIGTGPFQLPPGDGLTVCA